MIYTSYFKSMKHYKMKRFSIANTSPIEIDTINELVPDWSLVEGIKYGSLNVDQFEYIYTEQLFRLDLSKLNNALDNSVLLCWKKKAFAIGIY